MTFVGYSEGSASEILDAARDHGRLGNWVGGRHVDSAADRYDEVLCPYDGGVLGEVPLSDGFDLERIVAEAASASADWSRTPAKERVQVLYRLKSLLERELEPLALLVALESGKTTGEAKAEILKGIEVVEFACSLPHLITGRIQEVASGVDCSVTREPLGLVASVTPFNFPLMVPLWTLPIAIALGNAVVHKPSEQVPLSPLRLAELFAEAGLPPGVYSVLNGGREAVEALCEHPAIAAISFVGSTAVARSVYARGCGAGKRVLALGGAKNHLIALPDADPEETARAVTDAAIGCAGQRCMAASVLVTVGDCSSLIDRMAEYAGGLRVPDQMGAIINRASVERIRGFVDQAASEGARAIVDGRRPQLPERFRNGFWMGPTLIDGVRTEAPAAREEIFGPVLSIIRAESLDEALEIERASPYGNAASVFTASGSAAREVVRRASSGMVGVNIGIPVPRDPFAFGGWNQSKFGVGDITGESSINLWTRDKKTTTRWLGSSGQ